MGLRRLSRFILSHFGAHFFRRNSLLKCAPQTKIAKALIKIFYRSRFKVI